MWLPNRIDQWLACCNVGTSMRKWYLNLCHKLQAIVSYRSYLKSKSDKRKCKYFWYMQNILKNIHYNVISPARNGDYKYYNWCSWKNETTYTHVFQIFHFCLITCLTCTHQLYIIYQSINIYTEILFVSTIVFLFPLFWLFSSCYSSYFILLFFFFMISTDHVSELHVVLYLSINPS